MATVYDDDLTGRESADAFKTELGFDVPRLGVDKDTVEWLRQNGYPDLKLDDVLTDYTPQHRHVWKYPEYLKTQKIETDVIISKIEEGGAEAVWKFLLYKLAKVFPEPINYIDIVGEPKPEDYYPQEIQELQNYLRDLCALAYSDEWEEIQSEELEKVDPTKDGLLNVEEKNKEIVKKIGEVVNADENVNDVAESIKELLDSLPSITSLKEKYDNGN